MILYTIAAPVDLFHKRCS